MDVARVQVSCTLIGIKRISCLVVARLILGWFSHESQQTGQKSYQGSKIIPNLRDIGVQADGARIGVKRIPVLVDLVVQDADRAPEGRVAAVAVDRLLVGFVCLGVFLLRHVASAEQVPTLRISLVCG